MNSTPLSPAAYAAKTCDVHRYTYGKPGVQAVVDARTISGQWANMCDDCFDAFGIGLGLGLGQRFDVVLTEVTDEAHPVGCDCGECL